ncbi:MAG TPA: hypothetical protein VFC17_08845 [Candidatus Limnocylindrales bacterium]|nr:hypothetical protein [Candidatus Limnocylindrales bacterium]
MKINLTTVLCSAAVVASLLPRTAIAVYVTYDTTRYWDGGSSIGGWGPGQSSTLGETFVAPAGDSVVLNDFSFFAESYNPYNVGIARLYLQAFVFEWSGNMTGQGGGASGNALYLGPTFLFSPPPFPGGWVPLRANPGGNGLTLSAGHHYVMGFTLSAPANYAASFGDIEFEETIPLTSAVDAGGGAVWLNNGNNFAALNTTTWDTWGDTGDLAFTAHLTVVPEPTALSMTAILVAFAAARKIVVRTTKTKHISGLRHSG